MNAGKESFCYPWIEGLLLLSMDAAKGSFCYPQMQERVVSKIHGCRKKKFLLLFTEKCLSIEIHSVKTIKKGLSMNTHSVKTFKKCLSINSHSVKRKIKKNTNQAGKFHVLSKILIMWNKNIILTPYIRISKKDSLSYA